jgi:hypothetical protein
MFHFPSFSLSSGIFQRLELEPSTIQIEKKVKGLHVEVVIVIAHIASESSCWIVTCSSTQVFASQSFQSYNLFLL